MSSYPIIFNGDHKSCGLVTNSAHHFDNDVGYDMGSPGRAHPAPGAIRSLLSPREYYRPAHFAGSRVIGMRMTRGHFNSTSFRIGLVLIGRFLMVAHDAP